MDTTTKAPREMTLAELVEHFTTGIYDRYTVESMDPEKDHAYVSDLYGSGLNVSPNHFGVTVVVGNGRWGRGTNLAEAKREFRRQGGVLGQGYIVFDFPADTMFCGVGGRGITWMGEAPTQTEVAARK